MPEDSRYASGHKYAKILNMAKLWISQSSQYETAKQHSEYYRICLGRVLNISCVPNVPRFWIWQASQYPRVAHGSKCTAIWLNRMWICLNMPEFMIIDRVLSIYHTAHSVRSLYKLMSTYWETGICRTPSKV